MEFGFVPAQVVKDLEELGNWKARSTAVDKLQSALQKVSDKDVLLPTLSKLLRFLATLGEDPNFKINLSTLDILADLTQKVGPDIRPYLGDVMPGIIDKLGDNKVAVRQANARLLDGLMQVLQPGVVLDAFLPALSHGNLRIREAAVNTITQALLKHSDAVFDFPRLVQSLVQSLSDHSRVITAAIEALAVVHYLIGDQVQGLLLASGASVSSRLMLAARFASSELPPVTSSGTREREGPSELQISLQGTQMGSPSKQGMASVAGSASKPPPGPTAFRAMRNSSSLRKSSEASYPGLADLTGPVEPAPEELAGGLNLVGLEIGHERIQHAGHAGPSSTDATGERRGLGGLTEGLATISADPAADRGALEGLGVVGVGAPGMPSTSAALQSKQQGRYGLNAMASSNSAVSGKQDSYSVAAAQHQSAAAMQPQVAPVKRRPRPAVEAAVAMLHDPKQLQLTQSGASSYPVGVYGEQPLGAPAAGLKGFQLEWPLQPVNSAQGHLSSAAAKISSAASRYTNAVNAASYSVRAAALVADAASAASVSSSADASSPQEGRRSNLSRRSAHSSAQSFDTASSQLDPFAPSPRLAPEPVPGVRGAALPVQPASAAYQSSSTAQQSSASSQQSMGTGAYASAPSQRGQVQASSSTKGQSPGAPGPTRRALFPANLNDWSISASRNLDAPEMGSPPESDDEESTSGSSEDSSPDAASYHIPASPFGKPHQVPRAHSAFVPSRAHAFSASGLLTAESAPQGRQPLEAEEDDKVEAGPKKAGRLQLLKLRVAAARKTVTAGAAFRPFPGSNPPAAGRRAGIENQPYGVGPLETCPPPGSSLLDLSEAPSTSLSSIPDDFRADEPKSPTNRIGSRRKVRVNPPAQGKDGADAFPFSPSALSPTGSSAPPTPPSRWDVDNDSSTPSTPSVSTPHRLRPLSSALEDRLASASSSEDIPSAQDLQPSTSPAALLQQVLQQLQQANVAKRKELDWQMQNQALNGGRRLVAYHANVLMPQLHSFVLLAMPSVEALRSTTSKIGMLLVQEMFHHLRRGLDNELDTIVTVLAKRSGEVSVGGRDNFLAAESDKTLTMMVESCSETKVAQALLAHAQHKSPQVRAKIASHLDSLVQGETGLRLAGSSAHVEKVFKAAVGFLEEGSLDSRTYGKRIIWQVKQMVRAEEFKGMTSRVGAEAKQRRVWEVLDSASGLPAPPLRSAYSSRSPSSRQGLASPWGSGALDLPPTPTSPSPHANRHPLALQTPPASTRSPSSGKTFNTQTAEDKFNTPSTSYLLSEAKSFSGSAVGSGSAFVVRTGLTPAPGLGFSPKRGSGTAGYASKALAGRSGSLAAVQSRRRTSSNSDLSDKL